MIVTLEPDMSRRSVAGPQEPAQLHKLQGAVGRADRPSRTVRHALAMFCPSQAGGFSNQKERQ
jgi:hypothetical protein